MPCRSDYMEPNAREIESKRVCQLLKYLFAAANIPATAQVIGRVEQGAKEFYGNPDSLDADTDLLCQLLRTLPDDTAATVVYDGRNPEARKLADWWDHHQAADTEREAEEEHRRNNEVLRQQALSKLTPEEIAALRIK